MSVATVSQEFTLPEEEQEYRMFLHGSLAVDALRRIIEDVILLECRREEAGEEYLNAVNVIREKVMEIVHEYPEVDMLLS